MESLLTLEPEPVAASPRAGRCIHELFEEHVAATPDAVALVCGDESLTYGQLNRRANQLAHHLRTLGVGPDALVGICMHRSVEMIVGILGVLKAGGAYVPLDASYPKQRLATMLGDVELAVLLTTQDVLADLPASTLAPTVLCVDLEADAIAAEPDGNLGGASPGDLCYAIFTSGSTGQAKVAAVYHRGWTNLLDWFVTEFEIGASDRVLVVSSFSFDITQRSIAMPLVVGGQLHLLATRVFDPAVVRDVVARDGITLVNCAPSTFYPLVETAPADWAQLEGVRVVFLGGEPISASRLREWATSAGCATELANVYGVAECSDVSTFHRLRDYDRYVETSVPAGRPIFNSEIHLLDEDLAPVPPGERGEICIAGAGVGRGYVNDAALTAAKFVPNPFDPDPDARLYRTGDMGRYLPDGTLELIGRVDFQVKVRGNRIDLGDIEACLRQDPSVRETVVIPKSFGPGDTRLVAYVVPRLAGHPEDDLVVGLRGFAKDRLPDYMVPARFLPLADLPLNPNGKVDRGALADLEMPPMRLTHAPDAAPRSPVEARVAATFAEVLGIEHLGIHDNFFDLGGDSYLVTVLLGRLIDHSVRLSIFDFLSGPTVAQVVAAVAAGDDD